MSHFGLNLVFSTSAVILNQEKLFPMLQFARVLNYWSLNMLCMSNMQQTESVEEVFGFCLVVYREWVGERVK